MRLPVIEERWKGGIDLEQEAADARGLVARHAGVSLKALLDR